MVALWYAGMDEGSDVQFYADNANPHTFTISGGEEYGNVNFMVVPRPMHRVTGKVSLPKPGATFAVALGLPERPILPLAQALTDKDGNFSFEKVPSGTYDLFAAGPVGGYTAFESILGKEPPLFGRMRIQVSGQDVDGLNVSLSGGRSLAVTLRGSGSAAPPAGCPQTATVKLISLEPWGTAFDARAQALVGKELTIGNLPPGRFRVSAEELGASCYQVNQAVADLTGDVPGPVAVELAAAGAVRGTLKTDGKRAADFVVVLLDPAASGGVQAQLAFPDAQGQFEFRGLRPGRYRISAQPAAGASGMRWIARLAEMAELDVRGGPRTPVELSTKGGRP